jgi:hypothetical protein
VSNPIGAVSAMTFINLASAGSIPNDAITGADSEMTQLAKATPITVSASVASSANMRICSCSPFARYSGMKRTAV